MLTAIWTEVQITNRAIWKCDLSCLRQRFGGSSCDLGSAIQITSDLRFVIWSTWVLGYGGLVEGCLVHATGKDGAFCAPFLATPVPFSNNKAQKTPNIQKSARERVNPKPKPKRARNVPETIPKRARAYAAPIGPFFVLKFVRSRFGGARFPQPFPKPLVTVKYDSNTKWPSIAVNGR